MAWKRFNYKGTKEQLPKVEAAVSFASSSNERKSIITSIDTALAGLMGKTGTQVHC